MFRVILELVLWLPRQGPSSKVQFMGRFVSPKELATAIGASESSLKRWADSGLLDVTRTAGGHRRIPIAGAVRFIRSRGMKLVRPDVLGLAPSLDLDSDADRDMPVEERLTEFLQTGKLVEAQGLIMALYLDGLSIAELADGPIMYALMKIGEIWQHDKEGILIEHRATEACIYVVNRLRALVEIEPGETLQAIGCALSGDPYLLPSLIAGTVITEAGFNATNLGPDLPLEILRAEVRKSRPALVWISVSVSSMKEQVAANLGEFADEISGWGGLLVIGGRSVESLEIPVSPAVKVCSRMKELADIAAWVRVSRTDDPAVVESA